MFVMPRVGELYVGIDGSYIVDVVGESHKVARLLTILEFGGSAIVRLWFTFQFSVSISLDLISHHLDFSHTCNRVRSFVDFVDGIIACTEQ